MPDQIDSTRQRKPITVSLYDDQLDVLARVAKESGVENISAALRIIITDYAKRTDSPYPMDSVPLPAANGAANSPRDGQP